MRQRNWMRFPLLAGGLALSLAASFFVFSCMNPVEPEGGETAAYTEDGRPLISISVRAATGGQTGSPRSLTSALAQAGTDYYEVIFKDQNNGQYYRVTWRKGQTGRILVPAGNYAGPQNAIMLAGRYENKALLAAGELNAASQVIDSSTTSITFTLLPLKYEVKNAADSDFAITTTGYSTGTDGNHRQTEVNGRMIPYFLTPRGGTAEAHLAIDNVPVNPVAGDPHPLRLNGNARLYSTGYSDGSGGQPASVTGTGGTGGTGVALQGDGGLSLDGSGVDLSFTTSGGNGWCGLWVDIPLSAYDTTKGHEVWRLYTGVNPGQLDYGTNSPGGAVLLAVGNPAGGVIIGGFVRDLVLFRVRGASRVPVPEGGYTFADAWAWLATAGNTQPNDEYVITLWDNETSGPMNMGSLAANVKLTLEAAVSLTGPAAGERTLSLGSAGALFTVPAGYTLTLQNGATLKGRDPNTQPVVTVTGGTLNINDGGRITENNRTSGDAGSGVWMDGGALNISGGSIDHNIFTRTGGMHGAGICAGGASVVTMTGGAISHNGDGGGGGAMYGAAVYLYSGAQMTMSGGEISRNTSVDDGGGMYMREASRFTMNGGRIVENTVDGGDAAGGGIYVTSGSSSQIIINAGEISRNHARNGSLGGGGITMRSGTLIFGTGAILRDNTNTNITGPGADGYNLYSLAGAPTGIDYVPGFIANGSDGFVW